MSLDDVLEPEVMIAVGVTAAVMSPPVRKVLRKGVVYGLAGALVVGDKIAALARGAANSARHMAGSTSNGAPAAPATQPAAG